MQPNWKNLAAQLDFFCIPVRKHFFSKCPSISFHVKPEVSTVCLCKPKVIHGVMNVFHYQVPPCRKACGMFEPKTGNVQDDLCNFDL